MDNFKLIQAVLGASTFYKAKVALVKETLEQLEEEHAQEVLRRDHPSPSGEINAVGHEQAVQQRIDAIEQQINQWQAELAKLQQEDHHE